MKESLCGRGEDWTKFIEIEAAYYYHGAPGVEPDPDSRIPAQTERYEGWRTSVKSLKFGKVFGTTIFLLTFVLGNASAQDSALEKLVGPSSPLGSPAAVEIAPAYDNLQLTKGRIYAEAFPEDHK